MPGGFTFLQNAPTNHEITLQRLEVNHAFPHAGTLADALKRVCTCFRLVESNHQDTCAPMGTTTTDRCTVVARSVRITAVSLRCTASVTNSADGALSMLCDALLIGVHQHRGTARLGHYALQCRRHATPNPTLTPTQLSDGQS